MNGVLRMELTDFAGRKITFEDLSKKAKRVLVESGKERCMDVLKEGAIAIRNTMVTSMRDSPPTGRLYSKGYSKKGKTVYHRASSPGNAPRVDTGALVRSIGMDEGVDQVEVGSRITDPPYPLWLEKGTPRMAARPWVEPAFKEHEPKVKQGLMDAIRKAAEEMTK